MAMKLKLDCLLLLSIVLAAPGLVRAHTPSITIKPGTTTIAPGQTLQYQAKVFGLSSSVVKWEVNEVSGGSTTTGTITIGGLYQAPAILIAGTANLTITALGADGITTSSVILTIEPPAPAIWSVNPNPLYPGKYNVILYGQGFEPVSSVRNGKTQLKTTYVTSTQLMAVGEQTTAATGAFQVKNPDSLWGSLFNVPFEIHGAPPTISPRSLFVHLGQTATFAVSGATCITSSEGYIQLWTGNFEAPVNMPASNTVSITAAGPGGSVTAVVTLVDGAEQMITPQSVSVPVGCTKQFRSSEANVWKAKFGAISSTGLYTAPKVWPQGGIDVISVNGLHGSTSEQLNISAPVPSITAVSSNGHLPLALS